MDRKIVLSVVVSLALVMSAAAYFISEELPEKTPLVSGQYDIWATESASYASAPESKAESAAECITAMPDRTAPAYEQAAAAETEAQETAVSAEYIYIDLNTASIEEFMLLNGVGEMLAENIVSYRQSGGGFKNIEEIMNVSGIGEKTFLDIKDHIYVENPVYPDNEYEQPQESIAASEECSTQPEAYYEETQEPSAVRTTLAPGEAIDLNKAGRDELMTVPGMTDMLAESILRLREEIKYFSHPYELLYAEGMTEAYLNKVINYFYV